MSELSKSYLKFPFWPIFLTLFFHLLAIIFSSGFYHWDEHFQILEFLSYFSGDLPGKLLPWEFHQEMRSMVQPIFYSFIQWPQLKLGISNPFFHVFTFRLITSSLSLFSMWLFWKNTKSDFSKHSQKFYIYFLCYLWFLPFLHARHSSEAFSCALFFIGISIFFNKRESYYAILPGIILMFGSFARFQLAISILGLISWCAIYKRDEIKKNLSLLFGLFIGFGLCIAIDCWGYGKFTITPWNYFEQNLMQNKVSSFGINPWYDYLKFIVTRSFLPIGLAIIISSFYFFRKNLKHPITWMSIPFIIIHQLIGHKELRFLFPLVIFIPYILTYFFQRFENQILKWKKILTVVIVCNFSLLIFYSLKPAHPSYDFYKKIYSERDRINTLYYYGNLNPYHLAELPLNYFRKHPIKIVALNENKEIHQMEQNDFWVFIHRGKYLKKFENTHCKIEHSNYLRPLLNFKLGTWPTKNKIWALFHCQKNL